jgi:hypothetical protein
VLIEVGILGDVHIIEFVFHPCAQVEILVIKETPLLFILDLDFLNINVCSGLVLK